MKVIVMAAGEGKRLRPLTAEIPKPMVKVAGLPILEYTLSILPDTITEIILVIGYKKEVIRNHFGSSFGGRPITYVEQPERLGSGEALLRARPHLDVAEPFLIIYADDLYHPADLAACIGNTPKILVKETSQPENFGVCLIDETNDRLLDILEKRENPPTNLVNIGVYFLDHRIFYIPPILMPNGEHNLAEQIGTLAKEYPIYIERARFWHPIGYPKDIPQGEHFLSLPVMARKN